MSFRPFLPLFVIWLKIGSARSSRLKLIIFFIFVNSSLCVIDVTQHQSTYLKWMTELKKTLKTLQLAAGSVLKFTFSVSELWAKSNWLCIYSACGRTQSRALRLCCRLGTICRPLWYFTYVRQCGGLSGNWVDQKQRGPTGRALLHIQTFNSWVTDEITKRVQFMSPNCEWEVWFWVVFIKYCFFPFAPTHCLLKTFLGIWFVRPMLTFDCLTNLINCDHVYHCFLTEMCNWN